MENEGAKATSKPSACNKRKKHYVAGVQKRRRHVLEPGLKGFLCSCNFREKDCVRESYNILNEYADRLYGIDQREEADEDVQEDIEGLLKEIESIKSKDMELGKRFQVVDSGAKNFLFIRTTVEDPVKLAEMIMEDIYTKKKQKTRFLLRLVPVEVTCKAYADDIKRACQPLLERHFKDAPKSFSVVFNHRNNSTISKEEIITAVADMVSATRSDHKVNLKEADISIVIEVVRNVALIGVVPNFMKYRKYNLHMICSESGDQKNDSAKKCLNESIPEEQSE